MLARRGDLDGGEALGPQEALTLARHVRPAPFEQMDEDAALRVIRQHWQVGATDPAAAAAAAAAAAGLCRRAAGAAACAGSSARRGAACALGARTGDAEVRLVVLTRAA